MKPFYIFLFFIGCFFALEGYAQSPQSFKYQAVLRDNSGHIITNQNLTLDFRLLEDSPTGNSIYSESHSVSTNSFGLVHLEIGTGTTTDSFDSIRWDKHHYFLETSMDDGSGAIVLGVSPLMSVPYALHALTASNVDDADADSTNELQVLSFSNDTLFLSQGGRVFLGQLNESGDIQNLITKVQTDSTRFQDSLFQLKANLTSHLSTDLDSDSTNELQILSFSNDSMYLSNGGFVFLGHLNQSSETQNLFSKILTDSLVLSDSLNQLKTNFSNHVFSDLDTDQTNEIQMLSLSNDTLSLSNGGNITLGHLDQNAEIQNLNTKVLADSNQFADSLTQVNSKIQNHIAVDLDTDNTNEIQVLSLVNNTLFLSNGGSIILGHLDQSAEIQNLNAKVLADSVQFSDSLTQIRNDISFYATSDLDKDSTNEIQALFLSNDTLYLSNGGAVFIGHLNDQPEIISLKTKISSDSLYFQNNIDQIHGTLSNHITIDQDTVSTNELQSLSISGSTLSISNGNSVNLSAVNTDNQQLSKSLHQLHLTNNSAVSVDTEPFNELQLLSYSNDTLHLSSTSFNTFDHYAIIDGSFTNEIQTISKTGNIVTLSLLGGSFIDEVNDADADSSNEIQTLFKSGNTVSLSNGGGSFIDAVNDADSSPTNELELPSNPYIGALVYWNGSSWLPIGGTPNDGATIKMVGTTPTWVGGTSSSPVGSANIGDYRDGGIVFWVDPIDPTHGLVVMSYDLGSFSWGCNGTQLNVTDTTIGSGAQNTTNILANCSQSGTAAEACNNLSLNGYSDWFLPSKNEAEQIFLHKTLINSTAITNGGTALHEVVSNSNTFDYWTSSEVDLYISYPNVTLNGAGAGFKTSPLKVRAIRAF